MITEGTDGSEVEANVSSVTGKSVSYLQSKEDKVMQLTTIQDAYLFVDDTLTQPSSGAQGTIVGTVANDNVIVLKNVQEHLILQELLLLQSKHSVYF